MEDDDKLSALEFCKDVVDTVKENIRADSRGGYYPTSFSYELATRIEKSLRYEFQKYFGLTDAELDEFLNEPADE